MTTLHSNRYNALPSVSDRGSTLGKGASVTPTDLFERSIENLLNGAYVDGL